MKCQAQQEQNEQRSCPSLRRNKQALKKVHVRSPGAGMNCKEERQVVHPAVLGCCLGNEVTRATRVVYEVEKQDIARHSQSRAGFPQK